MRVVELFAGVGGFRKGFEQAGGFEIAWFNQWEPATKVQHAYDCYLQRFHAGEGVDPNSNRDICQVSASAVPDHDLLVGGFPCQDYSVASTLDKSQGIQGKKGVLWWEIRRIVEKKRPSYLLLENVDRLLKSPASQRGRDFAIVLACLRNLGYVVEWRVLNAADHGFPQKRRRVFIFAAHERTDLATRLASTVARPDHLTTRGFFAGEFATRQDAVTSDVDVLPDCRIGRALKPISDRFRFEFQNAGIMSGGNVWTRKIYAEPEPLMPLSSVLSPCEEERYYIPDPLIDGPRGWRYMKGSKHEDRIARNGHLYRYTEGAIPFPDRTDQPGRTLLTGEGGTAPSRSNHIIRDPSTDRFRVLTPDECELMNGFPPGWTAGIPERWRYFTMGNALVVGLVERIGRRLKASLKESEPKPRKRLVQTH